MQQEVWKSIPGYPGYAASSFGRIRSRTRIRRTELKTVKYKRVSFSGGRSESVHRLVWLAFRGPIPSDMVINHLDGNPKNNSLANLELTTHRGNIRHALISGLNPTKGRLSVDDIIAIKKFYVCNSRTVSILGKIFGVSRHAVRNAALGVTWKWAIKKPS